MLFTQLIQANLTTQILGRTIEHYAVTDSTNSDALELASEGAQEGTVVTTDNQTAGRGRHGRSWFCGVGKGLAFSVILRPETDGKSAGLLPLLAGVAVAEVLEQFNLQAALKWPNDILLNKKKCGGILTEGKFQGNLLSSTVIGIGINVNESARKRHNRPAGTDAGKDPEQSRAVVPPPAIGSHSRNHLSVGGLLRSFAKKREFLP